MQEKYQPEEGRKPREMENNSTQIESYKFPSITKDIAPEESLGIVKEYLEHISSTLRKTPGGPFEEGGIKWEISMPWNFDNTYFGSSLLKAIFERDDVENIRIKKLQVSPLSSGYVPEIYITTEEGEFAIIKLKDGVLSYEVGYKEKDENGNSLQGHFGKLIDGKIVDGSK